MGKSEINCVWRSIFWVTRPGGDVLTAAFFCRGALATALLLLVQVGVWRQDNGVFAQDIVFDQPEKIVKASPDPDSPGKV